MHHQLSRPVVELVRLHGFDEANVVNVLGKLWQLIRNPGPAFTMLFEFELMPQHLGRSLDKRKPLAFHERLWTVLAVKFFQIGFVVEEFKLAWSANHVQKNHPLCFRWMMNT